MVTFEEAFADPEPATRGSITAKLQAAASAEGYDLEGHPDDSFLGLRPDEQAMLYEPDEDAVRIVLERLQGRKD